MEKKILFLKKLAEEQINSLQPVPDPHSMSGYVYPQVKDFFNVGDGKDIEILEDLTKKGCLERKFFDKIYLCPYCAHYNLNIREVCPECQSSDILIVEMLHHIKCAYVAPETEFRKENLYICPKCHQQLRHSGLDYERRHQTHICRECKHIFIEPKVNCYCLACSQRFGIEKAISQRVYTYSLNEEGISAAKREHFYMPKAEQAFFNIHTGLYTSAFFQQHLFKEIEKAKRFNRHLSVAMLSVEDHDKGVTLFDEIALVVRENVRDMDIAARYDDTKVIIIFPELTRKDAQNPVKRIIIGIEKLNKGEEGFRVRFNIVVFPEDGKSADDLMTLLKVI